MISSAKSTKLTLDFGAPALAVCGFSSSGKTTLLEAAIPHLAARGLTVAVLKHAAHGFVVDREGKDSDRLFHAGATVALRGPSEQFLRRRTSSMLTLEAMLSDLARDHDLLLVEGHKDTPLPKLWLGNAESSTPPTHVTDVQGILPWDSDRLKTFLGLVDEWLPKAWRARPLFAGLLAGGGSLQMGEPKQFVKFGDSTFGEIAAHALDNGICGAKAGDNLATSASWSSNIVLLGAGCVPRALQELIQLPDIRCTDGPLAGLLAAHRWAPRAAWVLAACDHPWLSAADIQWLVDQRKPGLWTILLRQPDDRPCPALALYEPQALAILERSLLARGAADVRLAGLIDHPHTLISPRSTRGTVSVP